MSQMVVLTVPDTHLEMAQLGEQEDEAEQVLEQTEEDIYQVASESQEFEDRPKSYTELVDG